MRKLFGVIALLVVGATVVLAQGTLINSNNTTVRNSAPANVWFTFPFTTNVYEIQLGCSNSPVNRNIVWVYEEVNLRPVAYDFPVTITCNEAGDSFSLTNDITVNTPDHTVTIKSSTHWTVQLVSGRSGYYWQAVQNESQGQIAVE